MISSLTKFFGKRALGCITIFLSLQGNSYVPLAAANNSLAPNTTIDAGKELLCYKVHTQKIIQSYLKSHNIPFDLKQIIWLYLYLGIKKKPLLALKGSDIVTEHIIFTPFRIIGNNTVISYGCSEDNRRFRSSEIEILVNNVKKQEKKLFTLTTNGKVTKVKGLAYKDKYYTFFCYTADPLQVHICDSSATAEQAYGSKIKLEDVNLDIKGAFKDILYNDFGKVIICTNLCLMVFDMSDLDKFLKKTEPCIDEELEDAEKKKYFKCDDLEGRYKLYRTGLISHRTLACIVNTEGIPRYDLLLYDIYKGAFEKKIEDPLKSYAAGAAFFFGNGQVLGYIEFADKPLNLYEVTEKQGLDKPSLTLDITPNISFLRTIVSLNDRMYIVPVGYKDRDYKLLDLSKGASSKAEGLQLFKNNKKMELLEGLAIGPKCSSTAYFLGGIYLVIKNLDSIYLLEFIS